MVLQFAPIGAVIFEGAAGGAAAGGGAATVGSSGLLTALGFVTAAIGLTGDVDIEAARKRQQEAEKAKSTPIARSESMADGVRKCTECPPRCGTVYIRNTKGWSELAIAYQSRISGFPAGNGNISEWDFSDVKFDGFDYGACLLKEAKAKYDQFFKNQYETKFWWFGEDNLIRQATSQSNIVEASPPAQLFWYFMQNISYRYFTEEFRKMRLHIITVYQP